MYTKKEIFQYICEEIRKLKNLDSTVEIPCDMKVEDINLDSLSFVRLLLSLETNFHCRYEEEMLIADAYEILDDLAEYVYIKIN